MSQQDKQRPPPDHRKQLCKLISGLSHRHSQWQIFADFLEMAAISISNAMDKAQFEPREARYMEVVKRYNAEELKRFPEMFGELTLALEGGFDDVMGRVFHDLELHNKYQGQFFSPYHLCKMTAKMTVGDKDEITEKMAARGFLTACEPACGSGAMVIALAEALHDEGINYQQHLHVTATDIDIKCVHMAFLQLSLLHIPAVIVHGNSLSLEEFSHWHTPAHVMGGWSRKLRRNATVEPVEPEPVPVKPVMPQERSEAPSQLSLF